MMEIRVSPAQDTDALPQVGMSRTAVLLWLVACLALGSVGLVYAQYLDQKTVDLRARPEK